MRLALTTMRASGDDKITWTLDSSGVYSAKSAYVAQFAGQISSNFPTLIWKVWAPPKCKFFIWLLLHNRLWTAARLQLRGWDNNYFCALCQRSLETAQHLFFECPCSRMIWHSVASWSACSTLNPNSWVGGHELELEDWYSQAFRSNEKKCQTLLILTLWSIWNWRNDKIFRGGTKTPQMIVSEIKETTLQWSLAGCKALRHPRVESTFSE